MGYDGKNVPTFRKAEKYLVNVIYDKMLNEAIKSGKTSIVFLTGAGGAGKTQVLTNNRNIDFSHAGIVFNSAFNNYFKLDKTIKRAQEKGMKDVTVIAVYNDALTSFKNTVYRGR